MFTCPRCDRTSHHPEDERQGYCGACHDWTGLVINPRLGGCGCQYDAAGRLFADRCVCPTDSPTALGRDRQV